MHWGELVQFSETYRYQIAGKRYGLPSGRVICRRIETSLPHQIVECNETIRNDMAKVAALLVQN